MWSVNIATAYGRKKLLSTKLIHSFAGRPLFYERDIYLFFFPALQFHSKFIAFECVQMKLVINLSRQEMEQQTIEMEKKAAEINNLIWHQQF